MTYIQRIKNDAATMDRRETEDRTLKVNRAKNDELTAQRRSNADESMKDHRAKNDELTADRRELKDENLNAVLAVSLLILVVLIVGIFLI